MFLVHDLCQIVLINLQDSPLKSKVALFNKVVDSHTQGQAVNPFSNDKRVSSLPKPKISKEDYGR